MLCQKYFRTYQVRLAKFIKNTVVEKEEEPKRSPMPKLVQINIPNVLLRFYKLEQEISDQEGFLHGQKCKEAQLILQNVCVKVITKLYNDPVIPIVKETITCEFNDMSVNAYFVEKKPISLCHFQKGAFLNCRDYEFKTLKVLKTLDKFDQQKSELHIHPVCFQLYEAYVNINQRPYLEFDFDLYNTCLSKYIEECKKKYIQESKLSFTDNINITNNQIYNQNSILSSPSSAPVKVMSGGGNTNNNANSNTNCSQQKDIKLSDYLAIDDKILIETILNTEENVFETVISVPYLEQDFKTDFVEMYSYCDETKISLKSIKPRYYSLQKEENSVYEGIHQYTFNNITLEKIFYKKYELEQQIEKMFSQNEQQIEKIFTMESFLYDNQEDNEQILVNLKFQLLEVQIKEETFKDVLDIKNNFNIDYLDTVRQRKFVNPYQPPDPFTKPQKTELDFQQFSFLYEFNENQTIQLTCDYLTKELVGILKSQDQKTTLSGIKLTVGMINQRMDKKINEVVIESVGQKKDEKENRKEQSKIDENANKNVNKNKSENEEQKYKEQKIQDYIKINKREYDIFEIKKIEYTVNTNQSKVNPINDEYQPKYIQNVQFDTLTLRIDENMQYLSDYFSDFKESTNRVKQFSSQLNLKFPQEELVNNHKFITQMFSDPLKIQWKNLSLIIEDSKLNSFLLGNQAFIREYLQKDKKYNERHILLKLNETKRKDPLIAFYCDELTLQLDPLRTANSFQSILQFMKDVDDFTSLEFDEKVFDSFNCFFGSAGFLGASIKMRDYPRKLLQMDKGFIHLSVIFAQLKIQNKSKSLRVFYNLLTEFGNFDLTVGLCQASGINDLLSRFKILTSTNKPKLEKQQSIKTNQREKSTTSAIQVNGLDVNQIQNRPQTQSFTLEIPKIDQHEIKSLKPLEPIQEKQKQANQFSLPYWDNIRLCYHGKILMSKDSVMNFNLLTHIYPYFPDCLKFSIGKSFLLIKQDHIMLYIQDLLLKRKPRPETESHVLKIPLIQVECELDWNRQSRSHYLATWSDKTLKQFQSQKLSIFSKLNLPRVEPANVTFTQMTQQDQQNYAQRKLRRIVKNSEVPFIHYQLDFINWIMNLPQLRRDQLYLYKIGITRTKTISDEISNAELAMSDDSDEEIPVQDNQDQDKKDNKDEKSNQGSNKKHKRSGSQNKQKQSLQTEEDEQEASLGKNTDFLTLFTYSLNQQLNSSSGKQNILKHISEIKTCALMSSTRVIFSNAKHKLVSDPEEDDDPFSKLDPIIGLQFVFDSIQLSFNINHNSNPNKPNKQTFKMNNGYGKLDFMYGSVFKSQGTLLNLDPPQFSRSGDKNNSMYNPEKFAQYFGLKDLQLAEDMMIFNIQNELNGPFKQMSSIIQIHQDHLKIPKNARYNDQDEEAIETVEQKEFDFNISGTFFRSDSLVYEQDKTLGFEVQIQGNISRKKN